MNIFLKSMRIWVSATLSIALSSFLNLNFVATSGLVAILTIHPTKKETLVASRNRIFAFFVALFISFVCYSIFGFNTYGFVAYLFLYIPFCYYKKIENTIPSHSVIISHFLTYGNMDFQNIKNTFLIFFIGTAFGFLANLTLNKDTDCMKKLKQDTDNEIKNILKLIANLLVDTNCSCEKPFKNIKNLIDIAKIQAHKNYMNSFSNNNIDFEYITMRERQMRVLKRIYKSISTIKTTPEIAVLISSFINYTAEEYSENNAVFNLLGKFYELKEQLKTSPLPKTRQEFEDRAELFVALRDFEEFLNIKNNFAITH